MHTCMHIGQQVLCESSYRLSDHLLHSYCMWGSGGPGVSGVVHQSVPGGNFFFPRAKEFFRIHHRYCLGSMYHCGW